VCACVCVCGGGGVVRTLHRSGQSTALCNDIVDHGMYSLSWQSVHHAALTHCSAICTNVRASGMLVASLKASRSLTRELSVSAIIKA
jgi:hypothetical protein